MYNYLDNEENEACVNRIRLYLSKGLSFEDLKNPEYVEDREFRYVWGEMSSEEKRIFLGCVKEYEILDGRSSELKSRDDENTVSTNSRKDKKISKHQFSSWNLYEKRLKEKNFSIDDIESIKSASKNICERLREKTDPENPIRGAVVGNVQSGKTANFAGLMAMAADEGWNVFVVLTGTLNNLRDQTEERLKEDLKDGSNKWEFLQAGKSGGFLDGRIRLKESDNERYVFTIIKHRNRLEYLIRNLQSLKDRASKIKILIIDDEADQASVNTKKLDRDRSTINKLIVYLTQNLDSKGKPAKYKYGSVNYVSYTATPYAILLNENLPDSLYPNDFIFALTPSKLYFGPRQIFGSDDGEYPGLEGMTIIDDDIGLKMKSISKKGLPDTLKDCISWFLCCVALKRCRKSVKPVSMLINPSHIKIDHAVVAKAVFEYLSAEKNYVLSLCEKVYERETKKISRETLKENYGDYALLDSVTDYPEFIDIKTEIENLLMEDITQARFVDETENGLAFGKGIHLCIDNSSEERFFEDESYNPRIVYPKEGDEGFGETAHAFLVVGGNTLSRGLTIEGLVASYFLRDARQGDTLMQMGRWFGYRQGYELLPRIWMNSSTRNAFKVMTSIDDELREQIRKYSRENISPGELKLRVKNIPEAEICLKLKTVTSKNKMQSATTSLSFSGRDIEMHRFSKGAALKNNIDLAESFIKGIGVPELKGGVYLWRDLPFSKIENFYSRYHKKEYDSPRDFDRCFIWLRSANSDKVFDNVDFVLASLKDPVFDWKISEEITAGCVQRFVKETSPESDMYVIDSLSDKTHRIVNLDYDDPKIEQHRKKLMEGDRVARDICRKIQGLDTKPVFVMYRVFGDKESRKEDTDIIGLAVSIPDGLNHEDKYAEGYLYLEELIGQDM